MKSDCVRNHDTNTQNTILFRSKWRLALSEHRHALQRIQPFAELLTVAPLHTRLFSFAKSSCSTHGYQNVCLCPQPIHQTFNMAVNRGIVGHSVGNPASTTEVEAPKLLICYGEEFDCAYLAQQGAYQKKAPRLPKRVFYLIHRGDAGSISKCCNKRHKSIVLGNISLTIASLIYHHNMS